MRSGDQIRIAGGNRVRERLAAACERADARQHLVQDDRERPDVAAIVHLGAADVLRAHVGEGAEAGINSLDAGTLGRCFLDRRDAEIENLDRAVAKDHDVRRLDVAMNDAACVGSRCAARDLYRDG